MARNPADYVFWRNALKGEKQSVQESNPQCGFYKRRLLKDGAWIPVAFWRGSEGDIICGFHGRLADPIEHWTFAAKNPVTEEAYRFAITAGGRWADEPEPVESSRGDLYDRMFNARTSNMPSDPFEALKAEIEDKMEQAESFLKHATPDATSELDANKSRNIQAALLQLNKRADAMHKSEKQPHIDASRSVDARFAFRKSVADMADRLRNVFTVFMKEEEKRRRAEAQKKFEEDRRKAEEARKAAKEERRQLEKDDPFLAYIAEQEPIPDLPVAPEPVKIQVGGGLGRKAGLKTVYVPEIKDYRAALIHFADHEDVRAVIEKLVKADLRLHKTKTTVPGVYVIEERVAA